VLNHVLRSNAMHSIVVTDGYASAEDDAIKRVKDSHKLIDGVLVDSNKKGGLDKFCKSVITISDKDLQEIK